MTGRCMIRLASPDDGAAVAGIYGPVVAETAISFEVDPPSPDEMAARIASALRFAPWLACVQGGEVVGYAFATRHRERAAYRWSVDVGIYTGANHRRCGVGRALYRSLFALLRLQGFYVANAGITVPNAASVGLHESLGFRPVGVYRNVGYKHGAWRDVGWWQLALRDAEGEPSPPRTMDEVQRDPAWSKAMAEGESA